MQVVKARRWKSVLRLGAGPLLVVVGIVGLGIAARGTPKTYAGQCKAPYLLDVTFREGTSPQLAMSEVQRCSKEPEVVAVGGAGPSLGGMTISVYTHHFGRVPTTRPLFSCLTALPAIQTLDYPD